MELEVGSWELALGVEIWEWLGFGIWSLGFTDLAVPVFFGT
jgi:hypothetical protein